MLCINLDSRDPFFNLAAEEYFLKSDNENYFIIFINNPSVIIGKHQIAHAEANVSFITKKKIPLIRRISGGGAVYHDSGNLNFSFIHESTKGHQSDFKKYTEPIIDFLHKQNIDAQFNGKNQINAEGIKISGNAEHIHKNRVLHHGTLLFSSSLGNMHNALKKSSGKYESRAVQSNRTVVTNLAGKLKNISNIDEFRSELLEFIIDHESSSEIYNLTAAENAAINNLAESKYRLWEWNYAYGPHYIFSNYFNINGILHECYINVKDGLITDCTIEGSDKMKEIGKNLVGRKHMYKDLKSFLTSADDNLNDDFIFNFF